MVRATTASKKKKEKDEVSSSTLKYVTKVTSKRKTRGRMTVHLRKDRLFLQTVSQRSLCLSNLAMELAKV